jgi:methylated-DNA-protein-cysteine methyltransferase-like protein
VAKISWNRKKEENKDFFSRVFEIAKLVPHGRVTSYGAIARCIGSPQAARMVGWAMNQANSHPEFIPAHRVVNRIGLLSGKHHFGGSRIMQELLESEGVRIENDRVVDFNSVFWDPCAELI